MSDAAKVVWVTGASSGIGRAISVKFAAEGCSVAVSARRKELLKSLTSEIRNTGGDSASFVCDVTSEKSVTSAYGKIVSDYNRVDALIVNAGATEFKTLIDTTTSEYNRIIDTNLKGAFLCIRTVLPEMLIRKSGHIMLILSVAANTVFENSSVYSASKAGTLAMANCLRKEVRGSGIKVTSVIPGAVDTDMWDDASRRRHGKRMMSPADIAAITFDAYNKPENVLIEDIVVRPAAGDL